jgi:hypothetical protein
MVKRSIFAAAAFAAVACGTAGSPDVKKQDEGPTGKVAQALCASTTGQIEEVCSDGTVVSITGTPCGESSECAGTRSYSGCSAEGRSFCASFADYWYDCTRSTETCYKPTYYGGSSSSGGGSSSGGSCLAEGMSCSPAGPFACCAPYGCRYVYNDPNDSESSAGYYRCQQGS